MIFTKKTIKNIDVKDKRVLVRVDFNVPLKDDRVSDTYRIDMALSTIKDLIDQRAKVILCSHLGRPNGRREEKYSLLPVLEVLKEKLGQDVYFSKDPISNEAVQTSLALKDGEVHLLENLRYFIEEETNDSGFAEKLARHGEIFVQDGFGVVHRAHASTDAITKFLPSVAGNLVESECRTLIKAADHPARPLAVIIGGAKISSKMPLIKNFIDKADLIAIGGAMANTFLVADGHKVGKSLYDENELDLAREVISECRDKQVQLHLPMKDLAVADKVDQSAKRHEKMLDEIEDDDIILDFGSQSTESLLHNLRDKKTILWNGPLGMTELHNFASGSLRVASALKDIDALKVVGGGDTAEFVRTHDLMDNFSHVSTGGGASLELLSGVKLPGVEALLDKKH